MIITLRSDKQFDNYLMRGMSEGVRDCILDRIAIALSKKFYSRHDLLEFFFLKFGPFSVSASYQPQWNYTWRREGTLSDCIKYEMSGLTKKEMIHWTPAELCALIRNDTNFHLS